MVFHKVFYEFSIFFFVRMRFSMVFSRLFCDESRVCGFLVDFLH